MPNINNYQISREGILFIARREALVLTAYQDGPHMSIGFGYNDPKLKEGDTITVKEAFTKLKEAMPDREARINKLVKVPIEQHQFDALMSLHYQSGNRFLVKTNNKYPGPYIIDILNTNGVEAAANMMPECDTNLAGEKIAGLKARRVLERRMFLTAEYGDLSPIPFWEGHPRRSKRREYVIQEGDLD